MEAYYQNIHHDVVERCRKGDTKAQFELYKLYYKPMYNICLRMVGNAVEAEDVMQEAFLKAFTKIDTYEGIVTFGAWLKKIVINRSLDQLKKRKVKFEELNEKIPDEGPVAVEISEIQMEQLKNAIQKLPDGYRVVLSLYLLEGNVVINELEAKGTFNVSYGNLTTGKLKAPPGSPISIVVGYGKADIETINDANMEFKYSKLYADEITHLTLDSKYSTVNLHKTIKMSLESKYDGINIDEVDNFKAESKYTNYKIGLLNESFILNTGYGSVRINKVDSKFDKIKIENSYGGINIGLNELSYKLEADCSYCDLNYPKDRFKGNKIKDDQNFSLDGNVGNGGGFVSITSRYGGVKLVE